MPPETVLWSFPFGWTGVAIASCALLAGALVSYLTPVRDLPRWTKALLFALRAGFILLLLFCICGPKSVKEERQKDGARPKLAVVIDESSSMRLKDAKGRSRIDEAMKQLDEAIRRSDLSKFDIRNFAFSDGFRELPSPLSIPPANADSVRPTFLYRNIAGWSRRLSSESYQAVVCISDGIDNSGDPIETAIEALEGDAPPHVFVPAITALKSKKSVEFERIESPPAVRTSSIPISTAMLKCSGLDPSETVELQVKASGKVIWRERVKPGPDGSIARTLSFETPVKTPGSQRFEASASIAGKELASASWSIWGVEKWRMKTLLFMGSLDWAARYMRTAFENNERIDLDVKFSPDFLGPNTGVPSKIKELFVSPDELSKYDIVILMNMRRGQMLPAMESELRGYVERGGALLFMAANTNSAQEYAKSPLERLLPVRFEAGLGEGASLDPKTRLFLEKMNRYREGLAMERSSIQRKGSMELPPLTKFKLTEAGLASGVFSYAIEEGKLSERKTPSFEDFALVREAKPGAEILAIHPSFSAGDSPRILMAVQRFGKGRSAVLATDPLWRWKLSMDSASPSYEQFWSGLLSWLGAGTLSHPYWRLDSIVREAGRQTPLRFAIPPASQVKFEELAFSAETDGKSQPLAMSPTGKPGEYSATFTPQSAKASLLRARRGEELVAEASISGGPEAVSRELERLRPDIANLRRLGSLNNGKFCERLSDLKLDSLFAPQDTPVLKKEETPLWHNAAVFAALLAMICAELIIRRTFKML